MENHGIIPPRLINPRKYINSYKSKYFINLVYKWKLTAADPIKEFTSTLFLFKNKNGLTKSIFLSIFQTSISKILDKIHPQSNQWINNALKKAIFSSNMSN